MAADAGNGALEARLLEKAKTQLSSLDIRGLKEVIHEVAACAITDIVGTVEVLVDRSFKTGKWCSLIESAVTQYLQKDFDKVLALSADAYHFRKWDEVQVSLGSLKKDLTQACDAWEAHERRQVDAKTDTVKLGLAVDDLRTRLEAGLKERSATQRAEDHAKEAFARIDSVRDRIEEVHEHHKINSSVQLSSMRGEMEKLRQEGSSEPLKEEIRGMHRALEVVGIRCAEVAGRSEKAAVDVERKFQEYDATTKEGVLASIRTSGRELRRELSEHGARLDEAQAYASSIREELLRTTTEGDAVLGARIESCVETLAARQGQYEVAAKRADGMVGQVAALRDEVGLIKKEIVVVKETSQNSKQNALPLPPQPLEARKADFLQPLAEALHLAAGCNGKGAEANSDAMVVRLRLQQLFQSIASDISARSVELDTSAELFGGPSMTSTAEPPKSSTRSMDLFGGPSSTSRELFGGPSTTSMAEPAPFACSANAPTEQHDRGETKPFFGGRVPLINERELVAPASPARTKAKSSRSRPFEASPPETPRTLPPETPRTLPQLRGAPERSATEGFSPLMSQKFHEMRTAGPRLGDRGAAGAPVALPSVPGARPNPVEEARTWELDLTDLRNTLARVRLPDSDSYMESPYLNDPHLAKTHQAGGHVPAHKA